MAGVRDGISLLDKINNRKKVYGCVMTMAMVGSEKFFVRTLSATPIQTPCFHRGVIVDACGFWLQFCCSMYPVL